MDHMMIKGEQQQHPHEGEYANGQWVEINDYHSSHVQLPAHEYNGFGFVTNSQHGMAAEPSYNRPMAPMYSGSQHPQPIYPAQWPSMLTNPPIHTQPPLSAPPMLAPVSTFAMAHPLPPLTTQVSNPPHSTARKTLTDQDRRRMCQYHEDNPSVKQTEIGAMFGVERSTVSKVLRQKEKYLFQEDGTRSPVKKSKGKFPDIERALSNWAKNHQRQGLPLSDSVIRDKARFFATTVGSSESHAKVNSNSWLEKFKQKNHLMGSKPRKGSDANESDGGVVKGSGSQTPNGISPISPIGNPSPSPISPIQSRESLKTDSPDSYGEYKHSHSQSATSLASCFTDTTAPSSFSGQQSPNSPFYSPDMAHNAHPFIAPQPARTMSAASANTHRGRSQTFPMVGVDTNYSNDGESMTPKQMEEMMSAPALETPVDEYPERHFSISSSELHHMSQPASSVHSPVQNSSPSVMAPPPNPLIASSSANTSTLPSPIGAPSQDDARKALELVMNFFQTQPSGVVDPEEYMLMGKLMEKLKMQGSVGDLPGGMHSIEVGQKEMSRKRSIHPL